MKHNIVAFKNVEIPQSFSDTRKTGIELLDNFLSLRGGLVPSMSYMFTGESGSGKTTISNYIMSGVSSETNPAVFMSFEMSKEQTKFQFEGKVDFSNTFIVDELTEQTIEGLKNLLEAIATLNPSALVIDSLQMVSAMIYGDPTSIKGQSEIAKIVMNFAKETGTPSILIGQCNKEGEYLGPTFVKHILDAHLHASIDKKTIQRNLVFEKNRFGKVGQPISYKFADNGSITFVPFSQNANNLLTKEFAWFKAQETLQDLFADILAQEVKHMIKRGVRIPQLKFDGTNKVDTTNETFHPMINMWVHSPKESIQSTVFISMDDSRKRFTEVRIDQLRKQLGRYIDRFPQFKTVTDVLFLEFFVLMTQAVLGTDKEEKTFFKTLERIINNNL
jgi:energy-coupling factor transporter ATP-binding protein EcfA2